MTMIIRTGLMKIIPKRRKTIIKTIKRLKYERKIWLLYLEILHFNDNY